MDETSEHGHTLCYARCNRYNLEIRNDVVGATNVGPEVFDKVLGDNHRQVQRVRQVPKNGKDASIHK